MVELAHIAIMRDRRTRVDASLTLQERGFCERR
jgi:hypothetical protein